MKKPKIEKPIVVLSGGQDSTITLFKAIEAAGDPINVCAMSFDYGQRHKLELDAARTIAFKSGIKNWNVVEVPNVMLSSSPLTDIHEELEQYNTAKEMDEIIGDRVELTFVPMRNALFLTIAANHALHYHCDSIWTGVCADDNANYPDCTAKFVKNMQQMIDAALGKKDAVKLMAPLLNTPKHEALDECLHMAGCYTALGYSHTSYAGDYPPLDRNHATVLREDAFATAGLPDPLIIRAWIEGKMSLPDTAVYKNLPLTWMKPKADVQTQLAELEMLLAHWNR